MSEIKNTERWKDYLELPGSGNSGSGKQVSRPKRRVKEFNRKTGSVSDDVVENGVDEDANRNNNSNIVSGRIAEPEVVVNCGNHVDENRNTHHEGGGENDGEDSERDSVVIAAATAAAAPAASPSFVRALEERDSVTSVQQTLVADGTLSMRQNDELDDIEDEKQKAANDVGATLTETAAKLTEVLNDNKTSKDGLENNRPKFYINPGFDKGDEVDVGNVKLSIEEELRHQRPPEPIRKRREGQTQITPSGSGTRLSSYTNRGFVDDNFRASVLSDSLRIEEVRSAVR